MKVKEILKKKKHTFVSISEDDKISDAIKLMNKRKIGSLLVLNDKDALVGILTERDVLYECARCCENSGDGVNAKKVKMVMSGDLIIGESTDTIHYLLGIMSQNRIRHLPIMENEKLAGVISVLDLVKYQLKDMEYRNKYLEEYIQEN